MKFGESFGAVLEVAENGVPVGRCQRDGIELSIDAGLDDVGRGDSISVSIRMEADDDPRGIFRRDRCAVHVEHPTEHTP